MYKLVIDLIKAFTKDAWLSFRERRYIRKVTKHSDKLIAELGVIGAFIHQFEKALAHNLTDENAAELLDDFVNVVLPILKEHDRIEMDEDWETLCLYCKKYNVEWV
tara:strand:+ start:449 stop:766 length:318 start_codon:yes stop_codon:yes gene_type:complete